VNAYAPGLTDTRMRQSPASGHLTKVNVIIS
jgi:hypothetical protein